MKTLITALILLTGISLISCQKDYDPLGILNTPTGSGSFTAKIDGAEWVATNIKTAQISAGIIAIYGTSPQKSLVFIVADSGVHNYTLSTPTVSNVAAWTDSTSVTSQGQAAFTSNSWNVDGNYGMLNITRIDTVNKTMSGTFNVKVYRPIDSMKRTFTEGVFTNIPYTDGTPPPVPSTDSFRVKVNDTAFAYNSLYGLKAFGMISLSASTLPAGYPTVGLSFPDTISAGTYPLSNFDYIGQYNTSASVFLGADTGRVTILEHNLTTKRIRGTFNFLANTVFTHAPPNKFLTEGYFSIKHN